MIGSCFVAVLLDIFLSVPVAVFCCLHHHCCRDLLFQKIATNTPFSILEQALFG